MALGEIELFGTLDFVDSDNDGLDDAWEQAAIDFDPNDAITTLADITPGDDLDGDTLTNLEEFNDPRTNPVDADSDGDTLRDDVETNDGTFDDLATDTGTDPNLDDTDGDGLMDGVETNDGTDDGPNDRGTNPLVADSDGDTYIDGVEVDAGTDPNDPVSNPSGLIILGVGQDALLGGDITDPENDGALTGENFNATFFASIPGDFDGNGDPFDIFTNTLGGNGQKFCCSAAPVSIGATLDAPYVLTHFTLASSNDSPGRDPDVYRLQGSNDTTDGADGTWTDIYVYDNDGGLEPSGTALAHRLFPGNTQFNARNLVLRFEGGGVDFATPSSYSSFRILMQSASGWVGEANVGDPNDALALGELELFGTPGAGTPFEITDFDYDTNADRFSFTWSSEPGKVYSLFWSTDMKSWESDLSDSIPSGGETTSFPPADNLLLGDNPAPGARRIYFRVEENQ